MDDSEFSFENLNTLCWAAGSISGTLPDNGSQLILEEKTFFIRSLKNLLNLVEKKKGKEAKATIAANIMYCAKPRYLVGQFPKFMHQNFSFLMTVCRKLFEFMHEAFPGVMNMAVNTFLKITASCNNSFVTVQSG